MDSLTEYINISTNRSMRTFSMFINIAWCRSLIIFIHISVLVEVLLLLPQRHALLSLLLFCLIWLLPTSSDMKSFIISHLNKCKYNKGYAALVHFNGACADDLNSWLQSWIKWFVLVILKCFFCLVLSVSSENKITMEALWCCGCGINQYLKCTMVVFLLLKMWPGDLNFCSAEICSFV